MNKNSYSITTRADLVDALFTVDRNQWYRIGNNFLRNILSVESEDGSVKRFNVTGYDSQDKKQTFFVEVVD
jgi:hypothetical protein